MNTTTTQFQPVTTPPMVASLTPQSLALNTASRPPLTIRQLLLIQHLLETRERHPANCNCRYYIV